MTLCECEKATGSPNGLSCDKEGWFISSFEREGSWVRAANSVHISCTSTELYLGNLEYGSISSGLPTDADPCSWFLQCCVAVLEINTRPVFL